MSRKINIWAKLDWITVLAYLFMLLLGWISVYAAVYDEAHHSIFDTSQRYGKQLIWIIAAIVIAATVMMIDSKFYPFFSYSFYGFTILLLVGVLFFGVVINGQKSWFQFAGLQIQPSEFAKVATAMALAQFLSSTNKKIHDKQTLFKIGVILLLPVGLIMLQPDAGSAIVFFALILTLFREGLNGYVLFFLIMMIIISVIALLITEINMLILLISGAFIILYFAGRSIKKTIKSSMLFLLISSALAGVAYLILPDASLDFRLVIATAGGSLILFIMYLAMRTKYLPVLFGLLTFAILYTYSVDYVFENVLMPHQKSRILIVLGMDDDPLGQSYNINQSKIAIGSGGLTGKGFLQGTQTKFNFVPEQSTDFIFCTIGEEWGFAGSFVLITVVIFFLMRLVFLAERQRSAYARIFGYSLVSVLFAHFAINLGMTIGVVPVIGIPLPFISYGGSSIWAFTIMLFIFLRLDASRMEFLK